MTQLTQQGSTAGAAAPAGQAGPRSGHGTRVPADPREPRSVRAEPQLYFLPVQFPDLTSGSRFAVQ